MVRFNKKRGNSVASFFIYPLAPLLKLEIIEEAHKVVGVAIGDYAKWCVGNLIAQIFRLGVVVAPVEREAMVAIEMVLHTHIAPHARKIVATGISRGVENLVCGRIEYKECFDIGKGLQPLQ